MNKKVVSISGLRETPTLRNIRYELTGVCNYNCIYCSYKNTHNNNKHSNIWRDFINFFHIYDNISKYNHKIMFWGGEPTLHPDFFEICDNMHIPFGLYTNFHKPIDFWEKLIKYKSLVEVYVSIHCHDTYIVDIKKKLDLFYSMLPSGVKLTIGVMLEQKDINKCVNLFNYCKREYKKANISLKAIDVFNDDYYSKKINLSKFNKYLNDEQYINIVYSDGTKEKLSRFDIIYGKNINIKKCTGFYCNCMETTIHVDMFGNIYNCLVHDDNNKKISSIFDDIKIELLDKKSKICHNKYCYSYLFKNGKKYKIK